MIIINSSALFTLFCSKNLKSKIPIFKNVLDEVVSKIAANKGITAAMLKNSRGINIIERSNITATFF